MAETVGKLPQDTIIWLSKRTGLCFELWLNFLFPQCLVLVELTHLTHSMVEGLPDRTLSPIYLEGKKLSPLITGSSFLSPASS